jgi:hypothetical protein
VHQSCAQALEMTPQISYLIALGAAVAFAAAALPLRAADPPLEEVASFSNQQVTGVAVSAQGRVFVNFPFDDHTISVAEVVDGKLRPFHRRGVECQGRSSLVLERRAHRYEDGSRFHYRERHGVDRRRQLKTGKRAHCWRIIPRRRSSPTRRSSLEESEYEAFRGTHEIPIITYSDSRLNSANHKAIVYNRESNSAFLDLNSSSERMPF